MRKLFVKILPIIIGLLLSQVQACKSTHPQGWYLKVKKAEAKALAKEEAIKAKEKECSQKLLEENEQNPKSLVIQEEEKVFEIMEDQEIPAGSGNRYRYIPARKDDPAARTGRPMYLPIDTCKSYGINCKPRVKYI